MFEVCQQVEEKEVNVCCFVYKNQMIKCHCSLSKRGKEGKRNKKKVVKRPTIVHKNVNVIVPNDNYNIQKIKHTNLN